MAVEKTDKVWLNGQFIPFDEARVPILTHTLHYGLGVFEGIRYYACDDGSSAVFRLSEHVARLFRSARIVELEIPYTEQQIEDAILETIRVNQLPEGYIRPLVYLGEGAMGLLPADNPVEVALIVWPWGAYLGDEGIINGSRAKVSSYTRHHPNSTMTKSKTCGDYVNSILAKREVTNLGYDEAIMLDPSGLVSEASGENLFIAREGRIKTPPLYSVLEGITRDCVMAIARDKGIEIVEAGITRDELYSAEEAFLSGTAAEVTPIREVDDRVIGKGSRGPLTQTLQATYFDAVHGREAKYDSWLTRI